MDPSERALASFVEGDEEFLNSWTVDTINKGFSVSPPGMGVDETIGLSDRRLLWLDEELETIDLADVKAVKIETMQTGTASAILRLGVLGLLLGVLAAVVLWFFTSQSTTVAIAPIGLGLLTLGMSWVTARLRDDEDEGDMFHYVAVQTPRTTIQIFAEQGTVDEISERIETVRE